MCSQELAVALVLFARAGGPGLDPGRTGGQPVGVRDDEKQPPNQPAAEVRDRAAAKPSRRAAPLLTGQHLRSLRDGVAFLLGVVTVVLAGLVALAVFLGRAFAGFGGGSTSPPRGFWMEPAVVLLVLALILASLFLRRNLAFRNLTAIVVAASIVAAFIAGLRNAKEARLYYGMIFYLLAWGGFYLLAWLAERDKAGTGKWMPRELSLLQKLPRGLDQDEVRQRLGEPLEVFRQSSGETYWRYGHGPQEKWIFAIFGRDQRYQRFELD
jgi:hypothetical protein